MRDEADRQITRKAMAFDLCAIINRDPKDAYTKEEITEIIDAYIDSFESDIV